MSDRAAEARLLKGLLAVIVDADFTPAEATAVAAALKNGSIIDPVIACLQALGQTNEETREPSEDLPKEMRRRVQVFTTKAHHKDRDISVERMFNDVKRRKITKSTLFDMISGINADLRTQISDDASIREALTYMHANSKDSEWANLNKLVNGQLELDPFLRGIMRS